MNVLKVSGLALALVAAAVWWKHRDTAPSPSLAQTIAPSPNGFVSVIASDGAPDRTVVIFAPIGCPREAAQRANAMASELQAQGIPHLRSDRFSVNIPNPTSEQRESLQRTSTVLNGEIPAVFIGSSAKSNPTVQEVVAEYRRLY
jgi:hypothetical protein